MTTTNLSVLIPAYEMGGKGAFMLERAIRSIATQILQPFFQVEIVIADHSIGNEIESLCSEYLQETEFSLVYRKNGTSRGSSSSNLNFAFQHSRGEVIKILFQDDFLVSNSALSSVFKLFSGTSVAWAAVGFTHTADGRSFFGDRIPRYNSLIHYGRNTMSSPSTIAIRRESWLDFDPRLRWLMDVELYKRVYDKYGLPHIIPEVLVSNGVGPHQVSASLINPLTKIQEFIYVTAKHSLPWNKR